METADVQYASEQLKNLQEQFRVEVLADWGISSDGTWQAGTWHRDELDRLQQTINLLSNFMGGADKFIQNINGVTFKKGDIGSHGGEALAHKISLSSKRTFSAWTVAHELGHTWDANHGWKLSVALEKYTRGFTSPVLSFIKRLFGQSDSGLWNREIKPGKQGRLPGCNAAGYFYSSKPSGSDWNFNRVEDFAESVAMYVGFGNNNELSDWAEARIKLHLLPNGANDRYFGVDNWADYKKYFYPDNGDYTKTLRWKFVDELVKGNIKV
jgi:hypothetical protein